jgi:hypothetical protein
MLALTLTAPSEAVAQAVFQPGEKVMASPLMMKDERNYKPCKVVKFEQSANAYLLDCEGAEYHVQAAYIRAAKNEPEAKKKEAGGTAGNEGVGIPKDNEAKPLENKGKFNIGDRVLASPRMLKDDKYYQPCTVIAINPPNSYALRCDPADGLSFMTYSVRDDFVRSWNNATPAPTFECSFEQPPAVNKKTSPASAAVFKRVIYELEEMTNSKTRVGVKFETFQIGSPFKNVYVNARNGLLYSGFPQSATIYPIKTRFVRCTERLEDNLRLVFESGFACAKNRFGEWSCGVDDGVRKELDRQYVPKEQ